MAQHSAKTALLALLVVTIIWGWTFSWMKEAIDAASAQLGAAMPFVACLGLADRAPPAPPSAHSPACPSEVFLDNLEPASSR